MLEWTPWIIGAFLAGSIPFGVLIGRFRGINIREQGSKNIGATNVGRVLGKPWGRLCFALDMLKGALPVMIAGLIMNTWGHDLAHLSAIALWGWTLTMVAPVLGHMFPPWLGFRGGKGVA
ncbi:MAG: glycerol-3-phosphate acyltransferase, partial [Phycisphaerales bacterium]|nr:glycerol-3-phosphate acyltransferase [Phycisphaerales bacterium]